MRRKTCKRQFYEKEVPLAPHGIMKDLADFISCDFCGYLFMGKKKTSSENKGRKDIPYVNYSAICHSSQDRSERKAFSKVADKYAHSLEDLPDNFSESLVIGVEGSWGSGKTSLVNLIEGKLRQRLGMCEQHIFLRFNPWWFSNQADLNARFFKELSNELGCYDDLDGALADAFSLLGDAIAVSPIDKAGPVSSLVKRIPDYFMGIDCNSITELKRKISRTLRARKTPLFIFIDDLDRLTDKEVAKVFTLVKSIGNFDNMHYIIAYDRKKVAKAISRCNYGTKEAQPGYEYLEKIIQINIRIPKIKSSLMASRLKSKLNNLVDQYGSVDYKLGNYYRKKIDDLIDLGITPILENPRDSIRLSNEICFFYPPVAKKLDFLDFIAFQAMKVFCPEACHIFCKDYLEFFTERIHIEGNEAWKEYSRNFYDKFKVASGGKFKDFLEQIVLIFLGDHGGNEKISPMMLHPQRAFRISDPKNIGYYINNYCDFEYFFDDVSGFLDVKSSSELHQVINKKAPHDLAIFLHHCNSYCGYGGGWIQRPGEEKEKVLRLFGFDLFTSLLKRFEKDVSPSQKDEIWKNALSLFLDCLDEASGQGEKVDLVKGIFAYAKSEFLSATVSNKRYLLDEPIRQVLSFLSENGKINLLKFLAEDNFNDMEKINSFLSVVRSKSTISYDFWCFLILQNIQGLIRHDTGYFVVLFGSGNYEEILDSFKGITYDQRRRSDFYLLLAHRDSLDLTGDLHSDIKIIVQHYFSQTRLVPISIDFDFFRNRYGISLTQADYRENLKRADSYFEISKAVGGNIFDLE